MSIYYLQFNFNNYFNLGKVVTAKWKNHKDKFKVELQKIPIVHSESKGSGYKPKWPFFELRLFVKDTILPNVSSGNLPTLVTSETNESEEDFMEVGKDDSID